MDEETDKPDVPNDRAEATKFKINDMRQRLESLRKRKLEDAAAEEELIKEETNKTDAADSSCPLKKSKPAEIASPESPPSNEAHGLEDANSLEATKGTGIEVINLEEEQISDISMSANSVNSKSSNCESVTIEDKECPLVKLVFSDSRTARLYGPSIKTAIIEILSQDSLSNSRSNRSAGIDLAIYKSDVTAINGDGQLFTLDTDPAKEASSYRIPTYLQSYTVPINGLENSAQEPAHASFSMCFNCGGGHLLSDCTLPINEGAVAERKAKFMADKRASNLRKSRYHVDGEQQYAHHKPGVISQELRHALGLRPDQLPLHIYNMRLRGYPPGWLEEMKVKKSGITFFEDSEAPADTDNQNTAELFDIQKIIDYPGYNVDPPPGVIEESRILGLPPRNWNCSKEAMINYIGGNVAQPYQPRKSMQGQDDDDDVMVLDSDPGQDNNSPEECEVPGESPNNTSSPDIEVLEAQKSLILEELESGPNSPLVQNKSLPSSVPSTPEPSVGRSKSLSVGTPLMKSASPFSKLPSALSFSQGVSEHLNFENLPGSTGKYQKMKCIINKAKKVVDDLA